MNASQLKQNGNQNYSVSSMNSSDLENVMNKIDRQGAATMRHSLARQRSRSTFQAAKDVSDTVASVVVAEAAPVDPKTIPQPVGRTRSRSWFMKDSDATSGKFAFSRRNEGTKASPSLAAKRLPSIKHEGASSSFGLFQTSKTHAEVPTGLKQGKTYSPPADEDLMAHYQYIPSTVAVGEYKEQWLSMNDHIYQNGLLKGYFSDITLLILGKSYRLHRMIIMRNPFFRRFLQQHHAAADMGVKPSSSLQPIQIAIPHGQQVTTEAIDIILAFLYGCEISYGLNGQQEQPASKDDRRRFISSENVLSILIAARFFAIESLVTMCLDFITLYDLAPGPRRLLFEETLLQKSSGEESKQAEHSPQQNGKDWTRNNIGQSLVRYIRYIESGQYDPMVMDVIEDACLSFMCAEGYLHLGDAMIDIPLEWFSRLVEADAFWCPGEYERYLFAKTILQRRRQADATSGLSADEVKSIYDELFKHAIIYTHMTFEELNQVRADGLVSESVLMSSLWQQTRFRSMIESVPATSPMLQKAEPSVTQGGEQEAVIRQASSSSSAVGSEDDSTMMTDRVPTDQTHSVVNKMNPAAVVETKEQGPPIAPLRVGVAFKRVHQLDESQRIYSHTFFYGGSWWTVYMQRFAATGQDDKEKWGVFLRRSEGQPLTEAATASSYQSVAHHQKVKDPLSGSSVHRSVSYFHDPRKHVRAFFKLYNPMTKSYEPIFESKPNDYAETQSWGYRSREQVLHERDLKAMSIIETSKMSGKKVEDEEFSTIRMTIVLHFI